jgi:hypothetical protein
MSFQETLVSKKQKQTKKNTQNVQKKNQICKKKQRLPTSASLIAITTTKRD